MEGSSTTSFNQSSSSSSSSSDHQQHLNGFIPSIDSYDGKIMLAAIISLLVVVSFVLLLHIYTRWFLQQQTHNMRRRRRRQSAVSTLYVLDLDPTRLHRISRASINDDIYTTASGSSSSSSIVDKGLDASIISSLPLFIYKKSDDDSNNGELDCVICLSVFEDDDMGRHLPNCKHSFHVECVDIWLHSNSRCPICRAMVVGLLDKPTSKESSINVQEDEGSLGDEPGNNASVVDSPSNLETTSVLKDSPSSFGCSLKRMLSRSRSERKVFPSSSSTMHNELNV